MSEFSSNNRNWLLIIAIAAMVMVVGNGSIGIFHLNIGRPFLWIAMIVLAVWWINNGGCCGRGDDCEEDYLEDEDEDDAGAESDE